MPVKSYEDLAAWQRAMDLTTEVYSIVKFLPREETYALSDQMRRAAVSIPSNIAEGQGRNSTREFIYFLSVARGSINELKTQLQICVRLKYLSGAEAERAVALCIETYKILSGLISKLNTILTQKK
ncbi:MAG: four helix bundle protein [Selenomonadaceae bacterium]|nr:four helix bundle protein [Selenomonadaceae bacterium]